MFHDKGRRVYEFRKAWATACIATGFSRPKTTADGRPVLNAKGEPVLESTMIFHDMRRSAVRNLERAGVSQAGAMKVTGHKTISVYQRYRIVNEADIRDALTRTEAAMSEQKERKIIALREARGGSA